MEVHCRIERVEKVRGEEKFRVFASLGGKTLVLEAGDWTDSKVLGILSIMELKGIAGVRACFVVEGNRILSFCSQIDYFTVYSDIIGILGFPRRG